MPAPRRPDQTEAERLRALYAYDVLDTPPEPTFDRLTAMAARLFGVPIALVSLVETDRQWFKSAFGLCARETSTSVSFCKHTLSGDTILVVPDATADPRFADNALVTGPPHIRFYAGAPLVTPDGYNLGSLCIIDQSPRAELSAAERRTLQDLADIAVDELELRRAHEESAARLRGHADRVTQAIELSQDAISILDTGHRFVFMNRANAVLYGYPVRDLLGQPLATIYDAEGTQRFQAEVLPILERNGAWHGTSTARHRSGSAIEQEVSLARLPDGGMVWVARDVTARNAAQRARRRLRAELHQAQKLEAVGRLAGGIAHDFNNVLAAIAGYAGFLVDDLPPGSPEAGYARQIATASERGKTLVQQILSFSRRDPLAMTPIDLGEAVSETGGLLRAALPREMELVCAVPAELIQVRGNDSALSRAVMNLATNARDAVAGTDRPKVALAVRLRTRPIADEGVDRSEGAEIEGLGAVQLLDMPDGRTELRVGTIDHANGTAEVSVSDAGAGISPETLEHVLEPFYTTKAVGSGTGLGLSAVAGIALSHDGGLTVRTAPGRGTCVTLHLPAVAVPAARPRGTAPTEPATAPAASEAGAAVRQDADATSAPATAPQPAGVEDGTAAADRPSTAPVEAGDRRIVLVVDDERAVADMLAGTATRLGRPAIATTSPAHALELVRGRPGEIGYLLTDMNMPELSGATLAAQVKAAAPAVKVVLISGRGPLADCASDGAVDHALVKPVTRAALAAVLDLASAGADG